MRPAGFDAVVSRTVPEKPPVGTIESVAPADSPAVNSMVAGLAVSEKSGTGGGAVTWTGIETVRTRVPFVPVIVAVYDPLVVPLRVHAEV